MTAFYVMVFIVFLFVALIVPIAICDYRKSVTITALLVSGVIMTATFIIGYLLITGGVA